MINSRIAWWNSKKFSSPWEEVTPVCPNLLRFSHESSQEVPDAPARSYPVSPAICLCSGALGSGSLVCNAGMVRNANLPLSHCALTVTGLGLPLPESAERGLVGLWLSNVRRAGSTGSRTVSPLFPLRPKGVSQLPSPTANSTKGHYTPTEMETFISR